MKRLAVLMTPVALGLLAAGPAFAAWAAAGTGAGASKADALQDTTGGKADSATSSSLRLSWAYPTTGLQPTTWRILRGSTDISGSCTFSSSALACVDSGLAASTTYEYSVRAKRSAWLGGASTFSGTTAAAPDTTPPSVSSIVRAGANPTNATSVSWTVTFSEAVTGVDALDFSLAVSGLTDAGSITVTGSGTTRTVSATTGTGSGSLGLNLRDDDSIVDAAGNRLGGTGTGTPGSGGTGNGSAVGEVYTVDKLAPGAFDVQAANRQATPTQAAGTQGRIETGDALTLTFSERMQPSSLITGWDGATAQTITVNGVNGTGSGANANDTLTFTGANLGIVRLNNASYFTANSSFAAEVTHSTDGAGRTLVSIRITGTPSAVGTAGTAEDMHWTPSSAATDLAGNATAGTEIKETGTPKDFDF